jgi:hypothetical protein
MTSKARQLAQSASAPEGQKNVVINGAMNVAQRSTSVTGIGASAGYFTVDRFNINASGTSGRLTMTQTADGPSGFANCIKLDCTTADTDMDANKFIILEQRFEGQDLQRFMKGTSDAKEYAVSFYVKGNASATYVAELFDVDNTRQVSKTFSVTTSWTRVELTFPADTTGAFDDDNAQSLNLHLWLVSGTTYTSGTLSQTWTSNSGNNANRAVGGGNFFSSTDNTFFITGMQLEVGSVATEFEHRSYGEELALCKRYFEKFTYNGSGCISIATNTGADAAFCDLYFSEKRAAPTVTSSSVGNGSGQLTFLSNTGSFPGTIGTISYNTINTTNCRVAGGSYGTTGWQSGYSCYFHANSTGVFIQFDAEL